jgi:DNA polymerase III delta subunit
MGFVKNTINLVTGQGRHFFEITLLSHQENEVGEKGDRVRVSPETDPTQVLERATTGTLFGDECQIFFPDLHEVKGALLEILDELSSREEGLAATLVLPARNRKDVKKFMEHGFPLTELTARDAQKIAFNYVREVLKKNRIASDHQVIETLVLLSGETPERLKSTLDKICIAMGRDTTFAMEDFVHHFGETREIKIFESLKRVVGRERKRGIAELYEYALTGMDGEILKTLGAFQWIINRELSFRKSRKEREKIVNILHLLSCLDREIKGMSKQSSRELFLNFLVSVSKIAGSGSDSAL